MVMEVAAGVRVVMVIVAVVMVVVVVVGLIRYSDGVLVVVGGGE